MANIRAFQACDESSILSARTIELILKALRKKCFFVWYYGFMKSIKPKLVISGSARFQEKIAFWKAHFESKGYEVIAVPEVWSDEKDFSTQLTVLYQDFYRALNVCNAFFLVNEDKDSIEGYIGANGTAELIYATMLNLVNGRNIDIYITKIPSEEVLAYDEVTSFLKLGWISVYQP